MAFPSPPPSRSSALLFFLLLLAASASNAADTTTNSVEFEDMLQSLRNYGYSLFTNAIATSDIKYQLLAGDAAAASNFTLFAPKDELLYALDMAIDAADYVSTLLYHVIPNRRHTFADLKNLSAPFLDTLLPHYAVLIGKVRDVDDSDDKASIGLIVDGVRLAFPDIFIGSRIAVHGIDGILLTGLNMSRDLDGPGHIAPVQSPAPAVDASNPPTSAFDWDDEISPAPAFAFDGNIPVSLPPNYGNIPAQGSQAPASVPTPTASSSYGNIPAQGGQTPNVPTPAATSFNGNIPAKRSGATPSAPSLNRNIPARSGVTPTAPSLNRNTPAKRSGVTPAASSFNGNIPAKRSGVTPTAPSLNRNTPAKRSGVTPAASSFNRNIPTKRSGVTPAASSLRGNVPAKRSDGTRASAVNQNNVPAATAASSFGRGNIPAAATPRISQNQKKLGRKHQRKGLLKAAANPRISQDQKQLGRKPPRKSLRGRRHYRRHRAVSKL